MHSPRTNQLQKSQQKHVPFTNLAPQTSSELYWASRAQKAEALLAVKDKHYAEVGKMREEEEAKRRREIEDLERRFKEKYHGLERLIIVLVSAILMLIGLLIYLTTSHTSQSASLFKSVHSSSWFGFGGSRSRSNSASWLHLNLHLPQHFTLPILSPWTSVIEHQTSTTTTNSSSNFFLKYIALTSVVLGIVASIIIYVNTRSRPVTEIQSKDHKEESSLWRIYRLLSGSKIVTSGVLQWVWIWGWRVLRLIGVVPR